MAEEDKRGVVFRPSFYEAIEPLPDTDRLTMYDAIVRYGLFGETPNIQGTLRGFFALIKPSLDAAQEKYQRSVENGKKGGRPKNNLTETQQKPNDNPAETQQKPNDNLTIAIDIATANDIATASATEIANDIATATATDAFAAADVSNKFLMFWDKYPNKVDYADALKAWKNICGDQYASLILAGLDRWRNSLEWEKEGGRFIPRPARWLSELRWQDSPKEKIPQGATGVLGQAELEAIQRLLKEE